MLRWRVDHLAGFRILECGSGYLPKPRTLSIDNRLYFADMVRRLMDKCHMMPTPHPSIYVTQGCSVSAQLQ